MNKIEFGDCREIMRRWASEGVKVQTCVTSPPYFGLRDYGVDGQIGLEQTPEKYIAALVEVFRCVRDVLADDGTLWLNIGDSYAARVRQTKPETAGELTRNSKGVLIDYKRARPEGYKEKDLIGIPWMLAFALRADGWYLRQDIIWHKPNPMPESVRDRCTKAHEYIFLLSKSERYYFDGEAIKEQSVTPAELQIAKRNKAPHKGQRDSGMRETTGGFDKITKIYETRNRRSVWTVPTRSYKGAHFATYPPLLIEPCILAGSRPGDIVLDPFMGSGTTAAVAIQHGRHYLGCELNAEYCVLQQQRIAAAMTSRISQLSIFDEVLT
jgi:DNA modification methylase